MKIIKRTFLSFFILIAVVFLTFYSLYSYTNVISSAINDFLNSQIEEDAVVEFSSMRGFFLNHIELDDVVITLKRGETIKINSIAVDLDLLSVIGGYYDISRVLIDSVEINLERTVSESSAPPSSTEGDIDYFDLYDELNHDEFVIPTIDINKGRLYFGDGEDGAFLDEFNYVGSFIVKKGEIDIDIRRFTGFLVRDGKKDQFRVFSEIKGDESGMRFNQTRLHFNNSEAVGKGLLRFNQNNDFVAFIDGATLHGNDLGINSAEEEARFHFSAEANGSSVGVRAKLAVDSAYIEGMNIAKSDIEAYYNFDHGTVNVFESTVTLNEALLKIRGKLLGEENRAMIEFQNLDLQKFDVLDMPTRLNGRVEYIQSEIDFSGVSLGENVVELTRSRFGDYTIAKADIRVENSADTISIVSGSRLRFSNSPSLFVSGVLDRKRDRIALGIQGNNVQVDPLTAAIGAETITGKFSPRIALYGRTDNPSLRVTSSVDSLTIFDGLTLQRGEISYEAESISDGMRGAGAISSDSTTFNLADSLHFYSNFRFQNDSLLLDRAEFLGDSSHFQVAGSVAFADSVTEFELSQVELRYNEYRIRNSNVLRVSQEDSIFRVGRTSLTTPSNGEINFGGIYLTNGTSTLDVNFNNIQFEPFNDLIPFQHNILGFVDGNVRLHDLSNLLYDVDVRVNELNFTAKEDSAIFNRLGEKSLYFGKGELRYQFVNGAFEIEELTFADAKSNFHLTGKILTENSIDAAGQQFNLSSTFENVSIEKYNLFIEYYKTLSGEISGSFSLLGDRRNPLGSLNISTENLQVSNLEFSGDVKSTLEDGAWVLNPSMMKINEAEVELFGTKELALEKTTIGDILINGPFDFTVRTSADTISAISALNEEISMLLGDMNIELNIGGTFDAPELKSGNVSLKNTSLLLQKLGNPITGIEFETSFSDGIINLAGFNGETKIESSELFGLVSSTKTGKIELGGLVNAKNLLKPVLNIDVKLEDFYADYFIENAKVFVNSENLTVTGRDTVLVKGELTVSNSEVYFDYQNALKSQYQSLFEITDKFLVMDLNIKLEDNFRIYNDDATAVRGFDFILETPVGNPITYRTFADNTTEIRGLINITDGTITSMQTFEIENGTINLSDQDLSRVSFNPKIDMNGRFEGDLYVFKIDFNDYLLNLANVKIDVFDINDENRNLNKTQLQVVSLLLFGQEDLESFEGAQAFQTVAKSLANSNLSGITDLEVSGIGDEERPTDGEAPTNDVNVRVKTRAFRIGKGLAVKAVLNAGERSTLVEKIEAKYRISENLILFLTSDEAVLVNTQDSEREYELRLQWYYEF